MERFHAEIGCKSRGGEHQHEQHSVENPALDEQFFQRVIVQTQPFRIVHDRSSRSSNYACRDFGESI
jgi:hypothetical protein